MANQREQVSEQELSRWAVYQAVVGLLLGIGLITFWRDFWFMAVVTYAVLENYIGPALAWITIIFAGFGLGGFILFSVGFLLSILNKWLKRPV